MIERQIVVTISTDDDDTRTDTEIGQDVGLALQGVEKNATAWTVPIGLEAQAWITPTE